MYVLKILDVTSTVVLFPPYVYVLAKRLICAFVFCGYESFGMFTYVSMRVLQEVELLRHSCR